MVMRCAGEDVFQCGWPPADANASGANETWRTVHCLDTAVQPQVRTIDRCPSMSGTMRGGAVKSQHLQLGVACTNGS
jgi:hypothetical protein